MSQLSATLQSNPFSDFPRRMSRGGGNKAISELRHLLADVFVLYFKTKNFHWHMTGVHFRDYHLLLDEHADQLFAMTDSIAERTRKLGGTTLKSIGQISRYQRLRDSEEDFVSTASMFAELLADNNTLVAYLDGAHRVCEEATDVATASFIENWIDEAQNRAWFLREISLGSNA
ncbi:Dps family protein [Terriglobus roseus]|uniref:Starvation-inducible DNA-binding protein n=1 Tax=Terriglobus roseus TaxID=392734 RepID=A0A1H4LTL2_9BACT|nr:DNA starvation/stationary phase protection protein [Terriglobus roseus]SEB74150.1 starvation-inducible DNA-binding protein [Terriglobus roseus]